MNSKKEKVLRKKCLVCGKNLKITVKKDKSYLGGYYFGEMKFPQEKKVEYWECEKCFEEE